MFIIALRKLGAFLLSIESGGLMTRKPLRPCFYIGCTNLSREKYCESHKHLYEKEISERNRIYDTQKRDKRIIAFYKSKEWQILSQTVYLEQHGFCQECLKKKRIRIGSYDKNGKFRRNIVDHIVPIKVDWSRRLDKSNCWVLCITCHNKKTAEDRRKYGI